MAKFDGLKNRGQTRRQFLAQAAATSLAAPLVARADATSSDLDNPYQGVAWEQVRHVGSGSHIHSREQKSLDSLYRRGLRHLAISNYYPSVPCSVEERHNQYCVEQHFPAMDHGERKPGPFHWNEIIMDPSSGWSDELPAELKSTLPFEVGGPIFADVPSDVIICPNAEHHSMTDIGAHINGLGSAFASGNFDARGRYLLPKHGYPIGVGLPWRETFREILDRLVFPDGGGLTINHPIWSGLSDAKVQEFLDFDPRVLGIEIWNHTTEQINGKGWSLDLWDRLLATGRRCFGFAVSDHRHRSDPDFLGYNVLLIDSATTSAELPSACLRAYRAGRFYCTLLGNLRFEQISVEGDHVRVACNGACEFVYRAATGVVHRQTGKAASWTMPSSLAERQTLGYVRIEARESAGADQVFSQPIRLTPGKGAGRA